MSKEASTKGPSTTLDRAYAAHVAKIFVVRDQTDTAPVWGYLLPQIARNCSI